MVCVDVRLIVRLSLAGPAGPVSGFIIRVWAVVDEREMQCFEMYISLTQFMYLGLKVI